MKYLSTLSLSFLLLSTAAFSQAFSGLYTFANVTTTTGFNDPTPPPLATGLTFGAFSAYGTPNNPNASGRFSFQNWPAGATDLNDNYTSLTGALSSGEYYEVTLTPASGYSIDLSSITFSVQRSGTGIRTYSVRSSQDNFSSNLPATINPNNTNLSVQSGNIFFWNFDATTTNQNGSKITLSGPSFTGVTNPVTFRIYAWNSETTLGTFSIDNVSFTGTATALTILADFTSSPSSVCQGNFVNFTDNSQSFNGNVNAWTWNFGDPASGPSNISSQQNPVHVFSGCGTYSVTLIVSNVNADLDTVVHTVNILCNPVPAFTSTQSSGCAPLCVDFTDQTTNNPVGWTWSFGDNTSSSVQNPTHCYFTPGVYSITLAAVNANGCFGSATFTNYITVYASPIAGFNFTTAGLNANFTDVSTGGTGPYSITFDPGDGTPPLPFVPGTYTYPFDNNWVACLYITDANGCVDSTCHTISLITTGVNTIADKDISIFPNPSANGIFNVTLRENTVISVYDLVGGLILKRECRNADHLTLDLSAQPAGTYFVKLETANSSLVKKITVK